MATFLNEAQVLFYSYEADYSLFVFSLCVEGDGRQGVDRPPRLGSEGALDPLRHGDGV